jgi:hypothetical protein
MTCGYVGLVQPKLGAKKGRSAFADITNVDRNALGGVDVPVVKVGFLSRKLDWDQLASSCWM